MPAIATTSGAQAPAAAQYDTSKLHNVRGKWYDLSKFNHPGGTVFESVAIDIRKLIRSYHPFSEEKVRAILAKYEVTDVPVKAVASTTFDPVDSAFDKELKQIVVEYFKDTRLVRTATLRRWIEYVVLFMVAVLSTFCLVKGHWFAIVSTPLMWWIFGVGSFHDASHFAISSNWLVNAVITYLFPYFSSPLTWYYQHVVGHHPFVNIRGKDPDLYHHSPLHRYTSWHRFRPLHALQIYTVWIIWCLGTTIQAFVTDLVFIKKNVYQHVVIAAPLSSRRRVLHVAGRLATFLVIYTWPFFVFPIAKAFAFALLPVYIFSTLYLSISQVGHILEETYAPADKDFYKHQIQHTHNYGTNSWLCFYLSGGLNMQIEHHIFPGLNHCHLYYLAPKVKELCKKHGVTYNESSGYFEAVRKHLSVLNVMSHVQSSSYKSK